MYFDGAPAGLRSCWVARATAHSDDAWLPPVLPASKVRAGLPGAANSAAINTLPGFKGGLSARHSAVTRTRSTANVRVS